MYIELLRVTEQHPIYADLKPISIGNNLNSQFFQLTVSNSHENLIIMVYVYLYCM